MFNPNNTSQYVPQNGLGTGLGNALQLYMLKKQMQTPANTVNPQQMMNMGQNQVPIGPQSSQTLPNGMGQMNPNQFMQAGGMGG
jgi:hypothetical protein